MHRCIHSQDLRHGLVNVVQDPDIQVMMRTMMTRMVIVMMLMGHMLMVKVTRAQTVVVCTGKANCCKAWRPLEIRHLCLFAWHVGRATSGYSATFATRGMMANVYR